MVLITGIVKAQTIWIANSNTGATGGTNVITGANAINAAISAASPGDVIHVIPSPVVYTNVTVNKPGLSFYGIGTNPQKEGAKTSSTDFFYISNLGDNTVISGMNINRLFISDAASQDINGALIENCYLGFVEVQFVSSVVHNLTIRGNIIGKSVVTGERVRIYSSTNVKILNNIIIPSSSASYDGITASNGAIISNNLIFGGATSSYNAFGDLDACLVKNNIFYGVDVEGANGSAPFVSNTSFQNNMSFGGTIADSTQLLGNGNIIGLGNKWDINPLLVNVPYVADWNFSYDPHLQGVSTALGAGTDLKDIGITGGDVPFNFGGTDLPLIQQVGTPSGIPQGGTLPTQVKVKGN